MTNTKQCAKCGKKEDLEWCFGCEEYYCLDCVGLIESDDCYSSYVKYFLRCPVNNKHHMNSRYLQTL
jgi:hypothetical protein